MQSGNPAIIAATTDLFVQSRLSELARSLGLSIRFESNEQKLKSLTSLYPSLLVLDLASSEYDPVAIIQALKRTEDSPRILGFYPHIRKDLEAKARDAGIDFLVPNSSFLKTVRNILEQELDKS